ncbi:MAG: ATP-binding protein [Erythrobacter sp.]
MKRLRDLLLLRRFSALAAVLAILIALLGVQLLMSAQFSASRDLSSQANRIVESRSYLAELLELHLSAETNVRGYVLTQNEVFLKPYADAARRRETIFNALAQTGEPSTIEQLIEIQRLSDLKLANAAINIVDVRRGAVRSAKERIEAGEGRDLMDAIRSEIAAAEGRAAKTLARLERESEYNRRRAQAIIVALLAGIALVLIATTLLLSRAIGGRRAALIEVRRAGEQERAMFDGAVDGMLLLDSAGNILRANPSIERMFQYSEKDLLGHNNMFLMAEPFSEEQSLAWLWRVGRAGVDGAGRRQEFLGQRADGSTFETEVAISRFGEDDDKRYIAAIRDITHRKRAERMKSEFVSTVSHELRTPLTSIGGSLALLAGGAAGELQERAARLVAIAHSNCERLIRLINDLLDIEKIESGKMTFDMRKLTLASLIQRTVSANLQFARDNMVDIEVGLPPWPQCVVGDPDRLEQVLTNLVSNAIKFSPPGATVYVTTAQKGGKVRVEVNDRGAGVPEEFRPRIFSKFAMADGSDSRLRGGTGLGLAIVREIISYHGGTTGFVDRDGGGSTFWFELPLLSDALPTPVASGNDLPLILHLDDDLDCLSVVASAFSGKAVVASASSLADAQAVLSGARPVAACIVDISIGSENGLALLPELRAANPNAPVVLFTAFDDAYLETGADAVLVKSLTSLESLVDTTIALISTAKSGVQS